MITLFLIHRGEDVNSFERSVTVHKIEFATEYIISTTVQTGINV